MDEVVVVVVVVVVGEGAPAGIELEVELRDELLVDIELVVELLVEVELLLDEPLLDVAAVEDVEGVCVAKLLGDRLRAPTNPGRPGVNALSGESDLR